GARDYPQGSAHLAPFAEQGFECQVTGGHQRRSPRCALQLKYGPAEDVQVDAGQGGDDFEEQGGQQGEHQQAEGDARRVDVEKLHQQQKGQEAGRQDGSRQRSEEGEPGKLEDGQAGQSGGHGQRTCQDSCAGEHSAPAAQDFVHQGVGAAAVTAAGQHFEDVEQVEGEQEQGEQG